MTQNQAYDIFSSKFKNLFDKCLASNRAVGVDPSKNKLQPWFTNNLIKSCRKKSRLLKAYKKTGSPLARIKYITYKNIFKQPLRHSEKSYYENQFASKSHDVRQTWKVINSLLNKSCKGVKNNIFKIGDILTKDDTLIVNAFNNYFVNLGPHLAQKIPPIHKTHLKTKHTPHIKDSIGVSQTDQHEVNTIIMNIKPSSSSGIDHIPITVIKSVAKEISPILASLINHSFLTGVFPDALKIASHTNT